MLSKLDVFLAAPRGFCAGVDRAIQIVEQVLERFGPPIYVRHEIVHNPHVVDKLRKKGVSFIEKIKEAPKDRPIIFSAHGVPKSVPQEAQARNMFYIDATCPLVRKVHVEVERYFQEGYYVFLIGHKGHPEVAGTMGQIPKKHITLIETEEDAKNITPPQKNKLAYVTQTTLSLDDTKRITAILKKRFPMLKTPPKEDICYATTNRQKAVKELAKKTSCLFVVGAPNSSNSLRLVEVGKNAGCTDSLLLRDKTEIPWDIISKHTSIGITAGASAPEELIQEILSALSLHYRLNINEIKIADENVVFKLPKISEKVNVI